MVEMAVSSKSQSLFRDINCRELTSGFRVRKRPYICDSQTEFEETGAVSVQHDSGENPPLAISFCKTSKYSHILAVSDEDGYVSLFDTRRKFSSSESRREAAEKSRILEWVAHDNSIFDLCWIKDDTNILTTSGDQTIKVWDVEKKKCTGVLMGHTGSVKSVCSHPTHSDLLVSGSRDGSFAIWDLRCNITYKTGSNEACINSTSMVNGAHLSPQGKRLRRGKAASTSITSVLYLKDEISVATAGAVDSIVKFWDTRNLKVQVTQARPRPRSSAEKEKRLHGISSLSQDSNGVLLTASCMDHRVYLYNVLQPENGPVQSFSGCRIESFYIKSAISPDATHILSGSSDGNAYVWQVTKPEMDPVMLKSHDGEVTAVDWCLHEDGKIATSSDDFTVRFWNMKSNYCSSTRSPSGIRRRVMAVPTQERRKLLMDVEEKMSPTKNHGDLHSTKEAFNQINSDNPVIMPTVSTPEAQEKKFSSALGSKETFDKTPEAAMKSPSSVLNPPSSLKRRTIRDYFLAA